MSRRPPPKKKITRKVVPGTRGQRLLLRFGWILPIFAILVGFGILLVTYAFASLKTPEQVTLASSAEVYDVNGKLIGTYTGDIQRFLIDTEDLMKKKPFIGQAVVASEDRDFYEHNGISFRGILRAAWANLVGGEVEQGGSTITQQYVKNAVLQDPSRTVIRKAKEAVLAVKMERRYSKKEILGFYLNTIYLGRGAYGIEAAARTYFDKHAEELTLSEAAYLAGIIPAPESYQPDRNKAGARERRDRTIDLMVEQGYLGDTLARRAKHGRVRLSEKAIADAQTATQAQNAGSFMEWLRKDYLYPEFGDRLYTGGFKIHTTLDLDIQRAAESAVYDTLTEKEDPPAALVSVTREGYVRAMVGGKKTSDLKASRGFNYATSFPGRQPGSSFKPFTLLTAIEEGVSPDSRFSGSSPMTIDENSACNNPDGTPWEVDNYGGSSYGTIDLRTATTNSVNTVYGQLIAEIGPEKVADLLTDFGFAPKGTDEIEPYCANAFGGSLTVTPLELARAYAGFAGRGALPKVTPVLYITDSEGNCVKEYVERKGDCEIEASSKPEQVAEQNSVDIMTDALTEVVESGTATAASVGLDGRPIAGKTGTGQDNKDAWFAGYVPQMATVVWMGYPVTKGGEQPLMHYCSDPELCRPVHGIDVTGGSFPAQIWAKFMATAIIDLDLLPEEFAVPEEMDDLEIINSPPPYTGPTATPSAKPSPKESPSEEPSESPSAPPTTTTQVDPSPSGEPSPSVSPTVPPPARRRYGP
ncbi:MAG: penicillin-binding protein [Actinomycetota bacterium]|jgi:penicillin-binding protein 1A|nr:penicillin-binding protein [Actinomycetota bacterium]